MAGLNKSPHKPIGPKKAEPRIYLDNTLFRIDYLNSKFIEVGNQDHVIPFDKLEYKDHHYIGSLNNRAFKVNAIVIEGNYQEGSIGASVLNQMGEGNNVRLIDKTLLKELGDRPSKVGKQKNGRKI